MVKLIGISDSVLCKQFDVFTFSNPVPLFLRLNYTEADIILMDHVVGNQKSPDILKELNFLQTQQGLKKVPVVLHSGHEEIEEISISILADGFIRKPSSISEIRSYLSHFFTAAKQFSPSN